MGSLDAGGIGKRKKIKKVGHVKWNAFTLLTHITGTYFIFAVYIRNIKYRDEIQSFF